VDADIAPFLGETLLYPIVEAADVVLPTRPYLDPQRSAATDEVGMRLAEAVEETESSVSAAMSSSARCSMRSSMAVAEANALRRLARWAGAASTSVATIVSYASTKAGMTHGAHIGWPTRLPIHALSAGWRAGSRGVPAVIVPIVASPRRALPVFENVIAGRSAPRTNRSRTRLSGSKHAPRAPPHLHHKRRPRRGSHGHSRLTECCG
jgi:hypothetical protein